MSAGEEPGTEVTAAPGGGQSQGAHVWTLLAVFGGVLLMMFAAAGVLLVLARRRHGA